MLKVNLATKIEVLDYMYVTYIDESDNRNFYFVASISLTTTEVPRLSEELDRLANEHFHRYELPNIPEFHGYDMLSGSGDWRNLKMDYESQKLVFEECLDVILNHDIRLCIKGVSREKFVPRYGNNPEDIHHAALTWNLEKVHDLLDFHNSNSFLVSDEIGRRENATQNRLQEYKATGTFGWRSTILTRMVDTIYFCPSRSSRLLQATDLLLYSYVKRVSTNKDVRAQSYFDSMWSKISNSGKVYKIDTW
jgi:hypothetical protein